MTHSSRSRRRVTVLTSMLIAAAVVAACAKEQPHTVDGVSIPTALTTSTTERPATSTTQRVTTTQPPPTTIAPTTTYVPAESGPPSSIAGSYLTGGGRRPRKPCEPGPDLGQLVLGANCRHLVIDGMIREYVVYVPGSVKREAPAPLIVYLHGDDQNGDLALRDTGWKKRADERGYVVAFPTSLEYDPLGTEPPGWTFRWNDGRELQSQIVTTQRVEGYPAAAPIPADDVSFVQTMMADIAYQWPIDPAKTFVAGFQSGAGLATQLVIEMPDAFAAVALVGGGLGSPEHDLPAPPKSVPVLMIIGTDDLGFGASVTTTAQSAAIPLESDGFIVSDVGKFVLSRLAAFTGTDSAATQAKAEQHLTTYSMVGPGLGGGPALVQVDVVNGLANDYPLGQNNKRELIGTVEISNFFDVVTTPPV